MPDPTYLARGDRESGFDWQNYYRTYDKDLGRTTFDLSWSLFADSLLAKDDSHNFKFGLNYEQSKVDWVTSRTGGVSPTTTTPVLQLSRCLFRRPVLRRLFLRLGW